MTPTRDKQRRGPHSDSPEHDVLNVWLSTPQWSFIPSKWNHFPLFWLATRLEDPLVHVNPGPRLSETSTLTDSTSSHSSFGLQVS